MVPAPDEPMVRSWRSITVAAFAQELLGGSWPARPERAVVAIDGRSGAGKTTLARRLQAALPAATLVSTDDLAWHEPMFAWAHLAATGVLEPFRSGHAVQYRPPAWDSSARPGHIHVAQTSPVLLLEGVGAAQRALADLIDVAVWIQSDYEAAERLGILRDIASGVNGDEAESIAFWHAWMAKEVPFVNRERPWERADAIVAGASTTPPDANYVNVTPPLVSRNPTRC